MKITFLLPHAGLNGGIRVVAIYAKRLSERGHDVTVVSTPRRHRTRLGRKLNSWGLLGSPTHGPSHMDGIDVPWHVINRRRPIVDDDVPDADVVIATWWETAEWVSQLSSEKGEKVHFVQGHEVFPGQPLERVHAALRLPLHKITIARWLQSILETEYGFSSVPLIPNAVDHQHFYAPARGRQEIPTIGFLYGPYALKGPDVLFDTVARIRKRIPRLRVVAFGIGLPTTEFPLPPETEFIHRPLQPKIREIYSKLDVWICGSRSEGFHLMPLEAMACRTPVVATKVGGCVETVQAGINGYLVDIEDSAALAEKAVEILNLDDNAWRLFSEAAANIAAEYSWDRCTDMLEATIQRISSSS